jgi:glycosyltransferase involved in cell wall biosynthesis
MIHLLLQILAWLIALSWLTRTLAAQRGLPTIPNLLESKYDITPTETLTVIVPARNEARDIRATLESLLAQDYANIKIIAVDDRGTDTTGQIMDDLAAAHPTRLRILHITELPPEWLGKTHAMAVAAREADTDFLLFTDADVLFAPSSLRRALTHAVATQADHLVLMPTPRIRRWDEAALLSFFQLFGLWAARPWRVADPQARDAIGIGAFNLIRRSAYEQIGGFEALRMEIVEDLGIGRRIKRAGLRQRVAFGRSLVSLHWASGAPGLVSVMTKNIFAAVNFHASLLLAGCLWLSAFCILPFLLVATPGFRIPGTLILLAILWSYVLIGRHSGLSGWNALLAPFAAALFVFTLLRSMLTTLGQGGVRWRGTFYPLATLRKHTAPLR